MEPDGRLRLFILGAGFSAAAGLPLSADLWREVIDRARPLRGRAEKFFEDLDDYIAFRGDCFGDRLSRDIVNFEDFMSYLDIEHFLRTRGSDTWGDEGNEGTVVAKTLISKVLAERQPSVVPEPYLEFARRLRPMDWVLTFNYDTLLEEALDAAGTPYRLFANRYDTVSETHATSGQESREVVVLKMHGSLDWFDRARYEASRKLQQRHGVGPRYDIVFNNHDVTLDKLVDGPRFPNDPLDTIYRVRDPKHLYTRDLLFLATPVMLAPSSMKILYASRMQEFWEGIGTAGVLNTDVSIIGFSLPDQDRYAQQIIHSIVTNFQRQWWDKPQIGRKRPLNMVDLLPTPAALRRYKKRYRFVDWTRARVFRDGFGVETLDTIFDDAALT